MSAIKITIDGLAIGYFEKDESDESLGVWRVFVPKIESHNFKITVIKKKTGEISESMTFGVPAGSKIRLSTDGVENGANRPEMLSRTINVCSDDLYQDGVELKPNPQDYAGFITLTGIHLESSKGYVDDGNYHVWKATPFVDSTKKENIGEFLLSSGVTGFSNTDDGAESVLTVTNDLFSWFDFPPMELKFRHDEDIEEYEFKFENLCDETAQDSQTDFKLYYNVLQGVSEKFEIVPHTNAARCRQPGCSFIRAEKINNFSALRSYF